MRKRLFRMKNDVFTELCFFAQENKKWQNSMLNHIFNKEEESNLEVQQIAFNALKERVVLKKFKYIS